MQYGKRYLLRRTDGSYSIGEYIQTRGNDDEYPTFEVNGKLVGVAVKDVIHEITNEAALH